MTVKFIKIRIDEETRNAFQKKAKAEGMTMTALIQNWINQYLADETVSSKISYYDEKAIVERLEALEKKVEGSLETPSQTDQESEETLMQYIQYVDQRIDTLENVVINPLNDEVKEVKSSWKALFNQVRDLETKITQLNSNLDGLKQKTQQQLKQLTEYIRKMNN